VRFRRKPVEVDAMQWDGTHASARAIREAFGNDVKPVPFKTHCALACVTSNGSFIPMEPGDWIVREGNGSLIPMDAKAFADAYEQAEAAPAQGMAA